MKTIKFLLVLSLLIGLPLQAQWLQVPTPTQVNLYDVSFLNQNTGVVVGEEGTILKTTNAGNNWVVKNSQQTFPLYKISYIGNQTFIIAGYFGKILRSTDEGETWTTINTPASTVLKDVNFVNALTGYVCGGDLTLLKTTNAGLNWTMQGSSGPGNHYFGCYFFNESTGIIAQYPKLLKRTTNSGVNWTIIFSPPDDPMKFAFANSTTGVVFGMSGSIHKTTDAGLTWVLIQGVTGSYGLRAGCFLNENIAYAVGHKSGLPEDGVIIKTGNRGDNWVDEAVFPNALYGFGCSSAFLYAVGVNGSIYRNTNPVGITPVSSTVPDKYALSQNYPNPFNPTTNINFSLFKSGNVKLSVFDLTGKEVAVLVNNQVLQVGTYKVDFDARNLSSGIYFYRLEINSFVQTRKMMLVK